MVFTAQRDDGNGSWAFCKTFLTFRHSGTNEGEIMVVCGVESVLISVNELGEVRIE
jgi:hypothetical protein